jgi:hypothetical protein
MGWSSTHTPPSPDTADAIALYGNRVETPASWPPSDDMNIETHTPPRTLEPSGEVLLGTHYHAKQGPLSLLSGGTKGYP